MISLQQEQYFKCVLSSGRYQLVTGKKKKKKLESKVALIINAYMHSFSFFFHENEVQKVRE